MKKILFILSLLWISCQNKIEVNEIKSSKENLTQSSSISNPYDNEANVYYNFLHNNYYKYLNDTISPEEFDSIIVNSQYYSSAALLNSSEKNIIINYFSDSTMNYKQMLLFENYVLNANIQTNNLLKVIAYSKATFKFYEQDILLGVKDVEASDDCFDKCMRAKLKAIFEDGNWIDQAEYISGLPYTLLWQIASCTWNCTGTNDNSNTQS